MRTLDELYKETIKRAYEGKPMPHDEDPHVIDCLTHPDDQPLVWRVKPCVCGEADRPCEQSCDWDAIGHDADGNVVVNDKNCVGCQACVDACKMDNLKTRRDIVPVVEDLRDYDGPVYALVAPAVSGQFGPEVTIGKLRTALKRLGFTGMLEVAVFADILTLKEALEFERNVDSESKFQLTSCCCPMWISMIKRLYHQLLPNVPGSVSPMIAGGRTVKTLHPKAKTVFIGPCLAKKAERKEPDLVGAIDHVITYQELRDLFSVTNIGDLAALPEDNLPHASEAGIDYAFAGGVAEAVKKTVEQMDPDRKVPLTIRSASGVPNCKAMINDILAGNRDANFFEGMGCIGGCVGGPRAIIKKEEGKENVQAYGKAAAARTPTENPYVIELLKQLGFPTVEEFLEHSTLYDRVLDK